MAALRIFSYQPNPRLWKATIAARLNGVDIEVRGAAPAALADWLWDFDARPLRDEDRANSDYQQSGRLGFGGTSLRKTPGFLDAHPFGTVPAAFSGDGRIGIFESNSIARAVARLGEAQRPLYGADAYEASRIDSFLDASLVFGRDTQAYLLGLRARQLDEHAQQLASAALVTYASGMERALKGGREFLVGRQLSLADICFACELTMLWYERPLLAWLHGQGSPAVMPADFASAYPLASAHFARLRRQEAFAPDLAAHLAHLESISNTSTGE